MVGAGGSSLVELLVHWGPDDAPHFRAHGDPSGLLAVWLAELPTAVDEQAQLTATLHREIPGRSHRLGRAVTRLVEASWKPRVVRSGMSRVWLSCPLVPVARRDLRCAPAREGKTTRGSAGGHRCRTRASLPGGARPHVAFALLTAEESRCPVVVQAR